MNFIILIGGILAIAVWFVYLIYATHALLILKFLVKILSPRVLDNLTELRVKDDTTLDDINELLDSLGINKILVIRNKDDEDDMMYG